MKRGELVRRDGALRVKSFNEADRTVDVVCSTDAVDSYGEVVDQKWDLTRFNANPVVLYAHNSRDLPIGRAERMAVQRGMSGRDQLECSIRFATADANPKAEQVFQLFKQEILRAVSVGFVPNTVREEKRDGRNVTVLSDNELHELSVTPVPANHEALAKDANNDSPPRAARKDRTMFTQEDLDKAKDAHARELRSATEAHTATVQTKDARIAALEHEGVALRAAVGSAKDAPLAAVVASIGELTTARAAAEEKALGLEVDALIGVKILPAERDEMLELAKSNRPLFTKMIGKRTDLKLFERALGKAPEGAGRNSVAEDAGDTDGGELADAINTAAATA